MNSSTPSQPVWSLETPAQLQQIDIKDPSDRGIYSNATGFYYFCGVVSPVGTRVSLVRGPFATVEELKTDHKMDKATGALEFLGIDPNTPYSSVHGIDNVDALKKSGEPPSLLAAAMMAAMGFPPPRGRRSSLLEALADTLGKQKPEYTKGVNIFETVRSAKRGGLLPLIEGSRYDKLADHVATDFAKVDIDGDDRILVHKANDCGCFWHFDMVPGSGMIVGEFFTLEDAQKSADEYAAVYERFFAPATGQQAPEAASADSTDLVTVDRSALEEVLKSFDSGTYRPARLWKAVLHLEQSIGLPEREPTAPAVEDGPLDGFIRLHAVYGGDRAELDVEIMALDSFRNTVGGEAGKSVVTANGQTIFVTETCAEIHQKIATGREG